MNNLFLKISMEPYRHSSFVDKLYLSQEYQFSPKVFLQTELTHFYQLQKKFIQIFSINLNFTKSYFIASILLFKKKQQTLISLYMVGLLQVENRRWTVCTGTWKTSVQQAVLVQLVAHLHRHRTAAKICYTFPEIQVVPCSQPLLT